MREPMSVSRVRELTAVAYLLVAIGGVARVADDNFGPMHGGVV